MFKKILFILFFMGYGVSFGQVKIGDNPNIIDVNSILELESSDKVFVVTRITNAQMNAISPLNGAIVYNIDEACLFQYTNDSWRSLCKYLRATATPPGSPVIGDVWFDNSDPLNVLIHTWNGSSWIPINSNGSTVTVQNGISATGNTIELGGTLIKPTIIETDGVNTLAVQGLETITDTNNHQLVVADETTGVLKKMNLSGLRQQEVELTLANNGQSEFTTPLPITHMEKIYVYRNGVRIDFTIVNTTTIKLEEEAVCYQNDEIRIVQFY